MGRQDLLVTTTETEYRECRNRDMTEETDDELTNYCKTQKVNLNINKLNRT